MKQLTPTSSYSWWRDSRNSPKQSAWLHNTLGELEEKTQAMLSLVEAEADSFAQRVDLFYHKRPQLISMIEEQYRAYRSLAEQYDHLKFGFRQNVQVNYGLSCKAPMEISCSDSVEASYVVDASETENVGSIISEMEVKMETETGEAIQIKQLEMKNNKLEEELKIIKAENTKLRNESNDLHKELQFIKDENTKLWYENEINVQQLEVLTKKVSNLQKGNKSYKNTNLRDEIEANKENVCSLTEENTKLCTQKDVEIRLEKNEKIVLEQRLRLGDLQNEVHQLLEENRKYEIEVLERDEQKREAIRQLCFTIDTLMDKNKNLHNVLQKLQGGESQPNQIGNSPSQISWWKKFLNAG